MTAFSAATGVATLVASHQEFLCHTQMPTCTFKYKKSIYFLIFLQSLKCCRMLKAYYNIFPLRKMAIILIT